MGGIAISGQYEFGMVGLGVMGRNLLLNMADRGFSVAGYDKDPGRVAALSQEAGGLDVQGMKDIKGFADSLRKPRAVMMLVPAGAPVDAVIKDLLPCMEPGDLIIDGGNSFFKDTELREKSLAGREIRYLGVGISGGEHGARHGPSMMPGGAKEAYERVKSLLEAVAAKVGDEPCVAYLGPGGAGHYVKMVHNGIEYGLIELIAETYDILRRGFSLTDDDLHDVYDRWNRTELNGYLVDITSRIFLQKDEKTGKRLIDVILDEARQKGTGMWTSQDAMDLQVPLPTVDVAVAMRHLSAMKNERERASRIFVNPGDAKKRSRKTAVENLGKGFYAAMILTFAQCFRLLGVASKSYGYDLNLEDVARIWRGGCIIRAALLEKIRSAFRVRPDLSNLLFDENLGKDVSTRQASLKAVVRMGADLGIPVPGFAASLSYFDAYRSGWLPANLIQAQRDYFGAHTYERKDAKGVFHTKWEKE
jgi:6-phosphogluconate dehydrogenase